MTTPLEQLIEYSENVLKHSTINAHLIIEKAKQLLQVEKNQIVELESKIKKLESQIKEKDDLLVEWMKSK